MPSTSKHAAPVSHSESQTNDSTLVHWVRLEVGAPDVVRRLEEAGPQARFTRGCVATHEMYCDSWSIEAQSYFVILLYVCLLAAYRSRQRVRGAGARARGAGGRRWT